MNRNFHLVWRTVLIAGALLIVLTLGRPPQGAQANGRAVVLAEGFDDITTLAAAGWAQQNNSSPLGSNGWFQGNQAVFAAQAGDPDDYIGANFNNTISNGTISNWLISPELSLNNGDTLTFWTRTAVSNPEFPDRLQVRLSTAGNSTDVGSAAEDVGDFTTLLLDINPTLVINVYPKDWTQFTITLSGLSGGESGRFAFRYYVTDGGTLGDNSDYFGIDTVTYDSDATAIELAEFAAAAQPDGTVQVTWSTATEWETAGFDIYRAPQDDPTAAQTVNAQLIAAQGTQGQGADYALTDNTVTPGNWLYWLAELDQRGNVTHYPAVAVSVSAPTAVTLQTVAITPAAPLAALLLPLLLLTVLLLRMNAVGARRRAIQ